MTSSEWADVAISYSQQTSPGTNPAALVTQFVKQVRRAGGAVPMPPYILEGIVLMELELRDLRKQMRVAA
jgi:hypothetical protein